MLVLNLASCLIGRQGLNRSNQSGYLRRTMCSSAIFLFGISWNGERSKIPLISNGLAIESLIRVNMRFPWFQLFRRRSPTQGRYACSKLPEITPTIGFVFEADAIGGQYCQTDDARL